VRSRNAWITSIPGDVDVAIECLPGSTLPDELRTRGYDPVATGDGERIVPTAIIEPFGTGANGELEPLIWGSTRAGTQVVTHAGICKVQRYAFGMGSGISAAQFTTQCRRRVMYFDTSGPLF
jgi:hypothetical protein